MTTPTIGRRRTSPHALVARLGAVLAAFLLISFLLLTGSRAAFSATTSNPSSSVTAGAVTLADNDSGTALFNSIGGLTPLEDVDRCIDVTYTGAVDPTAVVMYMPTLPTGLLGSYLDLTVDVGDDTADPYGDCTNFVSSATLYTGTLNDFRINHPNYGAGLSIWDPTGTSTKTIRVRLTLQDDNGAQGQTTTFGFTWEVRTA